MDGNFGHSLTIGVEEELLLLDPTTFELAAGVERLLGPEGLKTELFSCLVETNTPVCETVEEARIELGRLRDVVREAAARAGLPWLEPADHRAVEADLASLLALDAEQGAPERELELKLKKNPHDDNAKVDVGRFKGLGEMMPAQLKETTMDPAKRTMLRVVLLADDREGTADSVERLMGTKAEARFAFISDKAEFASDDLLDV